MTIDFERTKARLAELKEQIETESRQSASSREALELDQQSVGRLSRMDAMQNQAMAEAQERKRRNQLVRIELAMRRLKEGEYGSCRECGEEIAEGRLIADPMAECCVGCAQR
jgi:DnaK suppressor protein